MGAMTTNGAAGCSSCAQPTIMARRTPGGPGRGLFRRPRRDAVLTMGAGCPMPERAPAAHDCGCHGTCGSAACALPPAKGAARVSRAETEAAAQYRQLFGRGAGLTPVEDRSRYSDMSDAEINRAIIAANARGDGEEVARLRSIQAERTEGHTGGTDPAETARYDRLDTARRTAIARAAAEAAGGDDREVQAAIAAGLRGGLDALNTYLRGTFNTEVATINSNRDITIARINAEERYRTRLLISANGTVTPVNANNNASSSTGSVATISALFLLAKVAGVF